MIEAYFTSKQLKNVLETFRNTEITMKDEKKHENYEAIDKVLLKMSGLAIVDSSKESGNKMSVNTGEQQIKLIEKN